MKSLAAALALATTPAAMLFPLEPGDDIDLEIVSFDSPIHEAGTDLDIDLSVSAVPEDETVNVEILAHGSVPTSRQAMSDWLGSDTFIATPTVIYEGELEITQGSSQPSITVPEENMNWGRDMASWGPRGIEVRLTTSAGTVTDRSVMITAPSFDLDPMQYTTVLPVTVQSDDLETVPDLSPDSQSTPDEIVASAEERSTTVIDGISSPGVTLMLDSSLVSSDTVRSSLGDFADGSQHEVVLLPAFDADLAAWMHTEDAQLFRPHFDQVGVAQDDLARDSIPARTNVYYQSAMLTESLAEFGYDHGYQTFLTQDTVLAPLQERYWTASALAPLDVAGDAAALVTDSEFSSLLSNDLPLTSNSDGASFDRQQLLLALTAIHYRERPNDPRPFVLDVSRDTMAALTDISHIDDTLSALSDAPWLEATTLSHIEQGPVSTVDRAPLETDEVSPGEVSANQTQRFTDALHVINTITSTTENPGLFDPTLESHRAVLVSQASKSIPDVRSALVESDSTFATSLSEAITPLESSTVNLIAQDSSFPVRVSSQLPTPATVEVRITSSDRRLEFSPTEVTLAPNAPTNVSVPVKAVGSGNVTVTVTTYTTDGVAIGTPATIDVRVRADWENMGTGVLAGVFLIILIVGIVRSARRGTRQAAHEAHATGESHDG